MNFSDSDTIFYFQFQSPAAEMKQAIFPGETRNVEVHKVRTVYSHRDGHQLCDSVRRQLVAFCKRNFKFCLSKLTAVRSTFHPYLSTVKLI